MNFGEFLYKEMNYSLNSYYKRLHDSINKIKLSVNIKFI